ncbi:PR domain zinc finger protein 10-like isoform X2 [Bacillus rossius redtenbacheri]|uniref:PR domain zinc finger protein 10-like isoform X2 n=1 Tax=Bacillus rossius redtenbacheri TaxID=93214 RepID=UPI002FDD0F74
MERIDPPDNPGKDGESAAAMPNQTGADLEWEPVASCELDLNQKEASPHLYFVTVEFVEGSPGELVHSFPGYEGDAFSPQPSSSAELGHRVSPLDPNMGSAAGYSPGYAVAQSPPPAGPASPIHGGDPPAASRGFFRPARGDGELPLARAQLSTAQYRDVQPATVVLSQPDDEDVKADCFDHIQLLISSGVGENIAYSIEGGHAIQSMLESIKEHGLVIEGVDDARDADMKLLPDDADLSLDSITLAVSQQHPGLIDQSLLESQLRLGGEMRIDSEVETDEVRATLGGRDLKYVDILLDGGLPSPSPGDELAPRRSQRRLPREDDGGSDMCGVFARKQIPKRVQFGPFEGVLEEAACPADPGDASQLPSLHLLVELDDGLMHRLDTSNENRSNWMRFVRAAHTAEEQNLIVNQHGRSLYFTTIKAVPPRQELLVWYGANYAARRRLPLLQPLKTEEEEQTWPCFECNEKFFTSEELQKHLNIHDTEKGDTQSRTRRRKTRKGKQHYRKKSLGLFTSKKYKTGKTKDKHPQVCGECHRVFLRGGGVHGNLQLSCEDHDDEDDSGSICRDRFAARHCDGDRRKHKVKYSLIKKHIERAAARWQCCRCGLQFDSAAVLGLHALAHAGGEPWEPETITGLPSVLSSACQEPGAWVDVCPQCSREFPSRQELVEHVSEHARAPGREPPRPRRGFNPAKPWKCERCYKSFATEERLQRHMLVHGSEETKPLQCDVCFKRFLNNSALACHIKIHTGKKVYECPICKQIFGQLLDLKEHVLIHSVNGMYTCPQCKKVFDEYSVIRKHIRAFHCDRKHKCSYCPKQFPTLDKLKMHMLRHSDHREFLCADCGKQFKRKDKLKEHMNRMHSGEKDPRPAAKPARSHLAKKFMPKISPGDYDRFIYKCHSCMVGFKRRGMLVNHLAKRHPEISPGSVPELNLPILKTTRDYYCQYCDKVYKSSSKRKAHILKNHPGSELPMSNRRKGGVPDVPGQPNPTYSQAVGSVTTRPHGCGWCHKQYASKAKLLQHQRKKHPDLLSLAQQAPRSPRSPGAGTREQPESPVVGLLDGQRIEVQLQGLEAINIIPEFQIAATEEELQQYQETGIIIDAASLKQVKDLGEGVSVDLLSQAMSELGQSIGEYRVSLGAAPDHFFKIVHATVAAAADDDPDDPAPFPPPASPRSWGSPHPAYAPYTAR